MDRNSNSPVLAELIAHSTFSAEAIVKLVGRHYGPRTVVDWLLRSDVFSRATVFRSIGISDGLTDVIGMLRISRKQ